MTQMSSLPSRLLVKTIFPFATDQTGSTLFEPTVFVSGCTGPIPSAFTTKIWKLPVSLAYAMRLPSGDQVGSTSKPAPSVICVWPAPPADIVKMWLLPLRALENAMRVPDGDQSGYVSSPGEVVSRVCPLPSAFIE